MSKYYSRKEIILRLIWSFVEPILFRFTPRHVYFWRNLILRIMGAKIGNKVRVFPSVRITLPWLLEIHDYAVISSGVKIYNLGKITIGKKTVISQYAHLCGGTHNIDEPGFQLQRTGLTVGNNVWIAADAFIGPRVHVGDNSIVGARSVVVKNVKEYSIVAGNPAKEIGERKSIIS